MHGPNCKLGNFCTVGRRLQEVNVLGGLILPIWGTIEKALSKQVTWDILMIFYFSWPKMETLFLILIPLSINRRS